MNPTLLIIDDEANILRSLKRLFRKEPFRVIAAQSAEEALDVLAREDVSVILCDQRMPGMTGSQLLNQVKETHPDTVRLVMSGYTELESVTAAINDGAVFKFLIKPWEDAKLLAHIREAFEIHAFNLDRRRREQALKQANRSLDSEARNQRQERYVYQQGMALAQSLLAQLPVLVLGLDNEGTVVSANDAAQTLLPTPVAVGLTYDLTLPETVAQWLQQQRTNAEHDSSTRLTVSDRVLRLWCRPFNGPGEASGWVVVGCPEDDG